MLFFADSGEGAVTQGMMIGSAVAVMSATLLLLGFLDNPYHDGPGSLRADRDGADSAHAGSGATRWSATRRPSPATSRAVRGERHHRGRRDGAALVRRGRDRVVELPGEPLERRAGEGVQPSERLAHRVDEGRRPRQRADPGRRRDLHAVDRRLRPEADAARRLLLQALPQGVPPGCERVDRDAAAQEPERPAHALRDARSTASPPEPRPDVWRRLPTPSLPRRAATSSAPRTTFSPSSCSPRPSSSPGSARSSASRGCASRRSPSAR